MSPRLLFLCLLALGACEKPAPAAAPTDAAPAPALVKNVDAKPGDSTTCPYSGRPFVVKDDSPQVEYEGKTYWICSESAAEAVRAEPEKYLGGFEG